MIGLSLTSSVRAVEADRDYWKGCAERDRDRLLDTARRYGDALNAVIGLQTQMSAWVMNKAENITPEQAAEMFYAQDDRWQASFFNCMEERVIGHHGGNAGMYGVPAGEPQWYHATKHLTDSGFETLKAMYEHACHHRENANG